MRYLDDLFLLVGAGLVVYATAQLNTIAAIYVAGGFCIAAGILIGLGVNKR